MSETGFEIVEESKEQHLFLDNRLDSQDVLFVVYLLGEILHTITLSEHRASVTYQGTVFSTFNDELFINGNKAVMGYSSFATLGNLAVFAVSSKTAETTFFVINATDYFVIGSTEIASFKSQGDGQVVIHKDHFSIDAREDFLYFNGVPLRGHHYIEKTQVGDRIFTPDFLLEKRPTQWKLTVFSNQVTFVKGRSRDLKFLRQARAIEFPEDFPKYRRSPRVHLEPPEETITIQKIEAMQKPSKNGLLKAILPPVGMPCGHRSDKCSLRA